jgi:hypothetical protein
MFRMILVGVLSVIILEPRRVLTQRGPIQSVPDPPTLSGYSPDVQQLLRTTYLGHPNQLPDPEEPADVLKQFLQIHLHRDGASPQMIDLKQLDDNIAQWQNIVRANPKSRHAWVGLATVQNSKADILQSVTDRRDAVTNYISASDIALSHGHIRYTREIAMALVTLNDLDLLDKTFGRILDVARSAEAKERYLALVDYADGLARLGQLKAWGHFEQAIKTNPANNVEAINRYAQHLLDYNDPERALTLLNRMTSIERMMHGLPVVLRRQALQQLGRDTRTADDEIKTLASRSSSSVGGTAGPLLTTQSGKAQPSSLTAQPFGHYNQYDDCRDPVFNTTLSCSPNHDWCWFSYTVNLGEILYNEARGESVGAQAMVAWTVRDRVLEGVSCDSYVGGVNFWNGWCQYLPCTFPSPYNSQCDLAKRYCCAEHGATFGWGSQQWQFNDAHQSIYDLANSGTVYRAFYVINGWMPEISTGYIPPPVGSCYMTCGTEYCTYGSNSWSASPYGPMEYLNKFYVPKFASCKWASGFVCANGGNDNYFWNRSY